MPRILLLNRTEAEKLLLKHHRHRRERHRHRREREGIGCSRTQADCRGLRRFQCSRSWRDVNLGVNGLGFVMNRSAAMDEPGDVIAAQPDSVFNTIGLNDNFSCDQSAAEIHRPGRSGLSAAGSGPRHPTTVPPIFRALHTG